MTEREMEDLLWEHPEDFLAEKNLKQFRRQQRSAVGRVDLIFEDRFGHLLIVEIKRGVLPREAIHQLSDYFGMLKDEFPDRPVELMVLANEIPRERRLACERINVNWREVSEKTFRDVAKHYDYRFETEAKETVAPEGMVSVSVGSRVQSESAKRENGWGYETDEGGAYFVAFVNGKGSCSRRGFEARTGRFLWRDKYRKGDYQESFSDEWKRIKELRAPESRPDLMEAEKAGLPPIALHQLQRQIPDF